MRKTAVQIGPSRYKIRKHAWKSKALARGRGYCCDLMATIGLRDDMPKDMEAEVLLHEILHAIYYTFNLNKVDGLDNNDVLEESIVSGFSTALATVFVQNPWLLPYLQKSLLTKR